jgi:outer membrane protein assembly factor BamB
VDCYDISSFSAQTTGAFVPNLIQGLHFEVERVCAALAKDKLVLLLKNRIMVTDLSLSVKVDKRVDIDPLAMSVDEEGAIYALIRKGNEEYALTMLTADGEIRTAVNVPAIGPGRAIPPIIGIDRAIYVLTQDSILALDRTGRRKWEQATGGEMAGGVLTSDNRLLVSTGSYIMSFTVEGTRGLVCAFPGETTTSPPVLVPQGGLVVTTQQALYYLFPKQR